MYVRIRRWEDFLLKLCVGRENPWRGSTLELPGGGKSHATCLLGSIRPTLEAHPRWAPFVITQITSHHKRSSSLQQQTWIRGAASALEREDIEPLILPFNRNWERKLDFNHRSYRRWTAPPPPGYYGVECNFVCLWSRPNYRSQVILHFTFCNQL